MGITYDQYIQNPMGAKNAVFTARDMYRTMYTNKWNDILLRENGEIKYKLYKDEHNYYVHIKIPSEVVEKFYYDVVIMFVPNTKEKKAVESEATLNNYEVRFFSNDPSFVFTFAHAFIKKKFFVEDLIERLPKEVVRDKAVERNPLNQIGYVKSLYFAYLELKRKNLFQKTNFDPYALKYSKKALLMDIEPASEKIAKRQELGQHIQKKEKRIRDANKNNPNREETLTKMGIKPIGRIEPKKTNHFIKPKGKITGRKK